MMKNYVALLVSLLLFSFKGFTQKSTKGNFVEVDKKQFDSCPKPAGIISRNDEKKQGKSLTLLLANNRKMVFTDNNSDTGFKEYQYFGNIKHTVFSLVKMEEYNRETFYLIHRITGKTDTLIGQPVFGASNKNFICINNPGTDKGQFIQVYEIKNNTSVLKAYIKGKPDVFFESVGCVNTNATVLKDNKGKYWKLYY